MPASASIQDDLIQQQILQAAQSLFMKHGYQKVTMDDVAKAIGKGRSSLYYYYKNKDEIFDAVLNAELNNFLEELNLATGKAATTEKKIYAFCMAKINAARKRKDFFNALETGMDADEISRYAQKKYAAHTLLMKGESRLLHEMIVAGINSKELPRLPQKEIETIVYVLLCSLHGLKREMILTNDFSHAEAAFSRLAAMTIHGIKK